MMLSRRDVLCGAAGALAGAALGVRPAFSQTARDRRLPLIVDTHQHLWDLEKFTLPWLAGAPEVLRRSYRSDDYREATRGLNVQAVYMEVDMEPAQHLQEAAHVVELCRDENRLTVAAVVGGCPGSADFADYVRRLKQWPEVQGVRQVLHGGQTPAGYCLQPEFVRGVRLLGEQGLSFDLCLRPKELSDGAKLAQECPDTRLILDHCGNADPKAFRAASDEPPWHEADAWRRDIDALAARPNVICKISGIVARAPRGWTADDLAPIVNHCLDAFGPQRVVFGSDWPVCLLGAPLRQWVDALAEIIAPRPAAEQNQLWHENARRIYSLPA